MIFVLRSNFSIQYKRNDFFGMGDDNGAINGEAAALLRRAANLLNPESSRSASLRSSWTAQDW